MFAEELHWTLEAGDLAAFYSADPTGFFIGELNGQPINHVIVKSASEVDFEKLLEYDTACFGGSRRSFLQKWITLPGRISLVANDEKENVIGFTVARRL